MSLRKIIELCRPEPYFWRKQRDIIDGIEDTGLNADQTLAAKLACQRMYRLRRCQEQAIYLSRTGLPLLAVGICLLMYAFFGTNIVLRLLCSVPTTAFLVAGCILLGASSGSRGYLDSLSRDQTAFDRRICTEVLGPYLRDVDPDFAAFCEEFDADAQRAPNRARLSPGR